MNSYFLQDSNIGIPDVDGKTPLHWAASSKDPEAVECVKRILVSNFSCIYIDAKAAKSDVAWNGYTAFFEIRFY